MTHHQPELYLIEVQSNVAHSYELVAANSDEEAQDYLDTVLKTHARYAKTDKTSLDIVRSIASWQRNVSSVAEKKLPHGGGTTPQHTYRIILHEL